MKSAYDLAMERLNKAAPTAKMTGQQKKELAEIDSKYAAKRAERELLLKDELDKAAAKGDFEAMEQLQKQLASDRKNIEADKEEKKDKVRQGKFWKHPLRAGTLCGEGKSSPSPPVHLKTPEERENGFQRPGSAKIRRLLPTLQEAFPGRSP